MSPQPFTPAQLMLLARGAIRLDGAILPLASNVPDLIRSSDIAASQLIKKKLANWIEVVDAGFAWKMKVDQPIGLVITDLGRAAIEAIDMEITEAGPAASKIAQIIERLRSVEGISLSEISLITGWQPHSGRAALTALRKRGFFLNRGPDEGGKGSRYWIAEELAR